MSNTALKVLTIRQPWAEAIVWQTKRTENRTWKTNHRGPLAIHAGAGYDRWAIIYGLEHDVRSAIVGVAEITDCHWADWGARCCGPWGDEHVWHWTLANVQRLAAPVPCHPGRLGLWTPPRDVITAVLTQKPTRIPTDDD